MNNVIKSIQLKKELDALRPFNKKDEARIMQKFRLDWNYHSNNLYLTRDKKVILFMEKIKG